MSEETKKTKKAKTTKKIEKNNNIASKTKKNAKKGKKGVNLKKALRMQLYAYSVDEPLYQKTINNIGDEVFTEQKYADAYRDRLNSLMMEYRKRRMDTYELKDTVMKDISGNRIKTNRLIRKTWTQEDVAVEIGIERQVLIRELKGYEVKASKRKDYYQYRRDYLKLFSLFFQVSPRYLMGLTDDVNDFGGIPQNIMSFENDAPVYSQNLIAKAYRTAASEAEKDEIITYLQALRPLERLDDEERFRSMYAWLRMIPAAFELAGKAFSVEYEKLDTSDYRLRKEVDKQLGFELFPLLKHIDKHDRGLLFLLTSLVDGGKFRLLGALAVVLEEGGMLITENGTIKDKKEIR